MNGSSIEELEFKSNGAGEAIFGGVTGSVKLLMRGAGSTKILGTGDCTFKCLHSLSSPILA